MVIAVSAVFLLLHLYNNETGIEDFAVDKNDFIASSNNNVKLHLIDDIHKDHDNDTSSADLTKKKLAVLVPIRNAFDELLVFLPKLTSFLTQHRIPFRIFLINQVDEFRFNRGALLNVGYLHVRGDFDYVILHDVDVYPVKMNVSYEYPGDDEVFHVIPHYLHPSRDVNYVDYLGCILAVPNDIYEKVDGISNSFWGWGGEDDDFSTVLRKAKVNIRRTSQLIGNKNDTFVHIHSKSRPRDTIACNGQNREKMFRNRQPNSGLNSTQFTLKSIQTIAIDNCDATLLNVELQCNKTRTPWCDCVWMHKTAASVLIAKRVSKTTFFLYDH